MIMIKLKEHTHYGRKRYEPACLLSETIMMLMPKRAMFTQADVEFLRKMKWNIEILEQSGWVSSAEQI